MRKKVATLTLLPSLLRLRVLCVLSQSLLQCRSPLREYSSKCEVGRAAGIVQGRQFEMFAIFEEHVERGNGSVRAGAP